MIYKSVFLSSIESFIKLIIQRFGITLLIPIKSGKKNEMIYSATPTYSIKIFYWKLNIICFFCSMYHQHKQTISVAAADNLLTIPSDVYQSINQSLELKCLLDAHAEQSNEVFINEYI